MSSANDGHNAMRERSRAVAERETSRLARPDRPSASSSLGHASKGKSQVLYDHPVFESLEAVLSC
jgi:hypothetical protein